VGIRLPAARYVRMSTEHQQYSIENQTDAIQRYADTHGLYIAHTYSDAGKSGLRLKNRTGLKQLLEDVLSKSPAFKAVLVYDVSRWGRFQDIDESAHYEFLCRSAGVGVHYCAESFTNDGNVASTIIKAIKRMMASEYSRELSAKVHEGAKRLAMAGFRQGAVPGYGYRRLLTSPEGQSKGQLLPGERKSIQEDRVVLTPGPDYEVHWVREIFRMFTHEHKSTQAIADELNSRGVKYGGITRREWYPQAVNRLLKNHKYAGINLYGRSTQRLRTPRAPVPRAMWTVAVGRWPAIVDEDTFLGAQERFANQTIFKSNEQLIADLRVLLSKTGKLSERIVINQPSLPSQASYRGRFGSMSQAFMLAGYDNCRLHAIAVRRERRQLRDDLLAELVAASDGAISISRADGHWKPELRFYNGDLVSIYVCPSFTNSAGQVRWHLAAVPREAGLVCLIARLTLLNDAFQDYFVLRSLHVRTTWTMTLDDDGLTAGRKLTRMEDLVEIVRSLLTPDHSNSDDLRSSSRDIVP